VKTRVSSGLIRRLASNQGLALQLAMAHTLHGDWRELFPTSSASTQSPPPT
jgi:hypothetical protein